MPRKFLSVLPEAEAWRQALEGWPEAQSRPRARLLAPVQALPFLGACETRPDPGLEQLLRLIPHARPEAPEPEIPAPMVELAPVPPLDFLQLPIGLFLRQVSFAGPGAPAAPELPQATSDPCGVFFRHRVPWQGAAEAGASAPNLAQILAMATTDAVERSRARAPVARPTSRAFFSQSPWTGALVSS